MEFKDKLKSLRKEQNVTQEALALAIHVSRSAIAKWEAGLGLPQEESLEAICSYFSISKEELFSNHYDEEDMVNKNIKIHKQTKKLWLLISLLCLVVAVGILFIVLKNHEEISEDSTLYSTVNLLKSNSGFVGKIDDFLIYKNSYGYSYQEIEIHRASFTRTSDLYIIRVKQSFIPGCVAWANDEAGYNKNAKLDSCSIKISMNDYEAIHPIYSWSNFSEEWVKLDSKWDDDILLTDKTQFYGINIEKIQDQYQFYYKESFEHSLYEPALNQVIRKLNYSFENNSSLWEYQMIEDFSKRNTFTAYSYYLFEVNHELCEDFNVSIESDFCSDKHTLKRVHSVKFIY